MSRARVLLADDHQMVTQGLQGLLSPEFDVVGIVHDGRALVSAAKELRPDVIVADVSMPHLNGIDALPLLKANNPGVKVVILTMHEDPAYARRAFQLGASGFVLKHSAAIELKNAIRAVISGTTHATPDSPDAATRQTTREPHKTGNPPYSFTPRQREILQLLAQGQSAKEIARDLAISARTVEFHKYNMMQIHGLRSTAELVHFAIKAGIVPI